MFDWARGSLLKALIAHGVYNADWDPLNTIWLKNWSVPWVFGLVEFTPQLKVLDVGSAQPLLLRHIHQRFGCEVHALDVPTTPDGPRNFGISAQGAATCPEVRLHLGRAGDEVLAAEAFDLVSCISVLEHTYDRISPLDPDQPLAHVDVLRDLVRMLRPGGMLLLNWDIYLTGVPLSLGWDFEVDYALLKHCGLQLASSRRRLRGKEHIFSRADSLFFDRIGIAEHLHLTGVRGTSINMLWRKPGPEVRVRLAPDPALAACYFPTEETCPEPELPTNTFPSTDQIDARFRSYMDRIAEMLQAQPLGTGSPMPGSPSHASLAEGPASGLQ